MRKIATISEIEKTPPNSRTVERAGLKHQQAPGEEWQNHQKTADGEMSKH
jgi:hypothetical protein